jgi:nucleotide-binding universal stress UspA family protein
LVFLQVVEVPEGKRLQIEEEGEDARGPFLDEAMRKATCELGILFGDLSGLELRKVLVVYRGDAHSRLAAEMTPAILAHFGAAGRFVLPLPPDLPKAQRGRRIEELWASLQDQGIDSEAKVFAFDDIVNGIARAASKSDLVIIGGAGGGGLVLPLAASPESEIADQCRCPVLWLREYEERESFWRSLLKSYRKEAKGNEYGS